MKKRYIFLFIGVSSLFLNSCLNNMLCISGNGVAETERRNSGQFYNIENSTSINIVFKKADTKGITLTADGNVLKYIQTEIHDNTLVIKNRDEKTCIDFKVSPLLTISAPDLEKVYQKGSGTLFADKMSGDEVVINMSGSGVVSIENVSCNKFSVTLSGSGNININNSQSEISDILLSGSGNINLSGESVTGNIKISGSGDLFSEKLYLETASVSIPGSGNAFTNIEKSLTGIIPGSGNIYVKGDPVINQNITGSGRIIKYK